MVKKMRGRQCLPMAQRQCKEERKKRGSTVNGRSRRETKRKRKESMKM